MLQGTDLGLRSIQIQARHSRCSGTITVLVWILYDARRSLYEQTSVISNAEDVLSAGVVHKGFKKGDYEIRNMILFERDLKKFCSCIDSEDRRVKNIAVMESVAVHKFCLKAEDNVKTALLMLTRSNAFNERL